MEPYAQRSLAGRRTAGHVCRRSEVGAPVQRSPLPSRALPISEPDWRPGPCRPIGHWFRVGVAVSFVILHLLRAARPSTRIDPFDWMALVVLRAEHEF